MTKEEKVAVRWFIVAMWFLALLGMSTYHSLQLQKQLDRYAEECSDRSDAPLPGIVQ